METTSTLTINIPAPSARARGTGGGGGGGGEKEEKIKTHSEKNISYKDKFHKTREKYDKVTAAHETYQKHLDIANAIVKNLQAENDLLLDAMFLADAGLYDRYFSTAPGTVPSPLDPYMFPEWTVEQSVRPPPPSSSSQPRHSSQHARYAYPHPSPYPHPSHSSSSVAQAVAGPSSFSHHSQRPTRRDHQHQPHPSKKRRGDIGPSPPEDLDLVGVPPSASNNANLASVLVTGEFDPPYDNLYRRTPRTLAGGHHSHPSHLNGNGSGSGHGSGGTGGPTNGTGHVRSVEHLANDDDDDAMIDVPPESVNGRP